jgi:hypothetical protein
MKSGGRARRHPWRWASPFVLSAVALLAACGDSTTVVSAPDPAPDTTVVPAPEMPPDDTSPADLCEQERSFASAFSYLGITYDYDPSASPAELADRVDLVARGTLRSLVGSEEVGEFGVAMIVLELEVSELLAGSGAYPGDSISLQIDFNPVERPLADIEAAFAPGLEVLVFLRESNDGSGWVPATEGFWVGCEDGAAVFAASLDPVWAPPATLDALAAASVGLDGVATPPAGDGCMVWGTISTEPDLEPSDGTYAVTVLGMSGTAPAELSLDFDVVQWLTGEPAVEAYMAAHPEDPDAADGPPNDYFVLNEHEAMTSAPFAPDADVWLVRLARTGSADVEPGAVDELSEYLTTGSGGGPYWLTFAAGTIVGVCEQYRP